jgi:gluconokinase
MSANTPLLLVVMGVSGCGKSTFSKALGEAFGLVYVDGDDLHSPDSVAKMKAGIALEDADRWPWLDRIAKFLLAGSYPNGAARGKVVACSALKRAYRDRIRQGLPGVRFIFLDGSDELIRSRMALRTGHFMQPDLLASQLRTLERPTADEQDVLTVNTARPVEQLLQEVAAMLQARQPGVSLAT